jgi:hypothetical protein
MSLMDFMISPPSCGRSVTDFSGWDAHEAQLRCPDEMEGDIWIWSTRRGLNLSSTKLPNPWSPWDSSPSRKNPHGRTGNRTGDVMISSQKLWPPDHEAGLYYGFMHVFGIDEMACSKTVFRIRKFPSNAVLSFSQKQLVSPPFNTELHRLSRLSAISHAKVWLKNNRQLWRPLNSHTWVSSNITKIIESIDTFNVLLTVHHSISV